MQLEMINLGSIQNMPQYHGVEDFYRKRSVLNSLSQITSQNIRYSATIDTLKEGYFPTFFRNVSL